MRPLRTCWSTWASRVLIALACGPAAAQAPGVPEDEPVAAVRLQPGEALPLNGSLDHPAWQRAPVFDRSYEIAPRRGRTPDYPTKVRVLYDERALYVGVEAIDPDPSRIRAPLVRHDQVNRTQDFVVVYVDPIGAKKAAQFFRVSAAGSTSDGLHTADNDHEDFSPDFDFDAASQRTATGYTSVFRIPYASLRYSAQQGAVWRVMVGRRVPREQIVLSLTVPLPREALSFIDRLQPLQGFEPPADHAFVQWRPTLTLRRTEERPFDGPTETRQRAQPSLDVKWRPRPELVLDATLNPDFSQVALDTPQLSRNQRFALFLQEKRPFFLESRDLLVSPTQALYTRSVNDPRWGLRGTWRGERLAGAALLMRDRGGGLTPLPGTYGSGFALQPANDTLMSRATVHGRGWNVGAVATERRYEHDDGLAAGHNRVAGLDVQWLVGERWRLKAQWLAAHTTAWEGDDGRLRAQGARRGGHRHLQVYHRTDRSEGELSFDDIDEGFRNDAGFLVQSGVRKLEASQNIQWHNLPWLDELHLYVEARHAEDKRRGQTVSQDFSPGLWLRAGRNTEAALEWVPAGKLRVSAEGVLHSERYLHLWAQTTPATWMPVVSGYIDAGRFVDAAADRLRDGRRWSLELQTRPLPMLELIPRVERLTLKSEGQRRYQETAAQLLGIWHLAARQNLRLILQRNSYERTAEPSLGLQAEQGRSTARSLTYTWRRSAGTVLYVGATRGEVGLPHRPDRATEWFAKLQIDPAEAGWW